MSRIKGPRPEVLGQRFRIGGPVPPVPDLWSYTSGLGSKPLLLNLWSLTSGPGPLVLDLWSLDLWPSPSGPGLVVLDLWS